MHSENDGGRGVARFRTVSSISGDPSALPVKELGPAIGYYTCVLGFTLAASDDRTAALRRDDVRIGLAVNGEDPEQASLYFGVSDVEAVRAELKAKRIAPTALRIDTYDGKKYRVFFAKEPYGVCFCFGQEVEIHAGEQ